MAKHLLLKAVAKSIQNCLKQLILYQELIKRNIVPALVDITVQETSS